MTIRITILTAGTAMLALASHAAHAQESEAAGDIVVVGALTDVEIDREEIEVLQANDLADLFRGVPSVSVGGGVGLAQKIYVRGLEDSLLNVTIDGAPQRGTLFHHIGRVTIEPEILETVDVQAGPGEATAGFGAVGGAIRFRTRNAVDMLQDGRDIGGIAKAGWFSNDGYKLSGTVYGRIAGDIGILASYVHVNRDPYKDGDGVRQLATGAEQNLGFVKVGGELGGGHRVTASYEQRRESGRFGQRPNWPAVVDQLFDVKGKRQTAVLNYGYEGDSGVGIEATGYWTRTNFTQNRDDRWGLYGAEIETYGFDARAKLAIANHDITVGAEHRRDRVTSEYLGDPAMWQDWAWDPDIGRFTEKGSLMGVYVQDHWRLADPLLISFGARYDAYDLDQKTYRTGTESDGLSFNIGAEFEIVPGLSLNAGFAEAFRGKEIGDAFTLEKNPAWLSLSPTLRPERVDNIEGGVKYDAGGFTASAVYYEMTIKNVILDQLGRDRLAQPLQDSVYYENVGKFKSKGVELRAGYRTGPFSIDGYYNHYDSRLNGNRIEGYEHIALGNSMGDNWAVTAGFQPSDRFNFRASLTRVEDLNNIEVLFREVQLYPDDISETQFIDKPGYTTVDLFGSWRPFGTDRLELQAAVYNLFDKRYIAHASVADYGQLGLPDYAIVSGLPEPGRNVRLTASVRF